ncbi:PREDICTED: acyl-coenzyme A synthetase ACSM3, mitochondrial-like [Priapulus caudatus]|uniref:medium-chain acyl-CoA ligase n=1 Tax=Priapulus caudatus TaxID=37621 RepID=A0ABM1EYR1_PRICU|nr:PREDICTED: acyl-coenzyme A synthetase ACSM3, mitochondrial-like [Priapulus caudatus]
MALSTRRFAPRFLRRLCGNGYGLSNTRCTNPMIFKQFHATPLPRKCLLVLTRSLCVAPSNVGFHDYELERRTFKIDVPHKFNFVRDVIEKWAEKEESGERKPLPALWFIETSGREHKWSYGDLAQKAKRGATALETGAGLARGDRTLIIMPKMPEWWLIYMACVRSGIVLCPGTTLLRPADIEHRLQVSAAVAIIAGEDVADTVDQVAKTCPNLKTKIVVGKNEVSRNGWLDFKKLYNNASDEHECADTLATDAMNIFFTSGTTGHPKMTLHTQASYGLGHLITGRHWLDLSDRDVLWALSDTGWAKSAYSNVFAPWLQGACAFIHEMPKFDSKQTLNVLLQYPVTVFCAPPTGYRMMVLDHDLSGIKHAAVRHCVSAGEPLNPEVIEKWKEQTGHTIREGYGQTETTLLAGTYRCIPAKAGSMGKPAPGYDLQVREAATPACSTRGGYEMIILSGFTSFYSYRIGPFEVESALIEHPAVAESAVISSPDPVRGEVVKAVIVLTDENKDYADKDALIKEIQDHVKEVTAPYKYPRKVEFVEQLPKTISGKIRRVELRDKEWGRVKEEESEEDLSAGNK